MDLAFVSKSLSSRHALAAKSILQLVLFVVLCMLAACKDADTLTTPRIIDTELKRYTLIDSVVIPVKSVKVDGTFNDRAVFLTILPTQGGIELVRFSDSSWGMRSNIVLFAQDQQQDTIMLDTIAFRSSTMRLDDSSRKLEGLFTSAESNASRCLFRNAQSIAIDTADTLTRSVRVSKQDSSFVDTLAHTIITHHHYGNSVVIDTAFQKFAVFGIRDTVITKTVDVFVITVHKGVITKYVPIELHPGYYKGEFVAPVLRLQQQGNNLVAIISLRSQSLPGVEQTTQGANLTITMLIPLPQ